MDLSLKITLLAMVAQIVLTIWAIISTGRARVRVLQRKELHIRDIALSNDAYPKQVKQLQNNMRNQFETPPVFYAGVVMAAALGLASWALAVMAVLYVILRMWHRYIHIGQNNVIVRFKVFIAGLVVLGIFWGVLTINIIFA